jgi:2-polyprenyl-3-methyl-5-hydroxy-6-metoxy-1,4-benzoquinol methylase
MISGEWDKFAKSAAAMSETGRPNREEVTAFYDEFVGRQARVGINRRHNAILAWLLRFGMRPDDRVLEIGCGAGTLTQLLAEALPRGSVFGADLSPRTIEAARERLGRFGNAQVVAGDVLEVDAGSEPYDVIVLPDVVEHIPIEMHDALFGRIAAWVKPEGFVLIHYPNPHHLEWFHENHPEKLQIVDQPIPADLLTANAYRHGLYLDYFERYSIWIREGDYIAAVFRPASGVGEFTRLPQPHPSLVRRVAGRVARGTRRLFGRGQVDGRPPTR